MSVYQNYEAPGGGGLFLKLKDAQPVSIRLMSDPYIFNQQFDENSPVQTKYAWVIYNQDEGKGQVLQLPISGFRQIQELASDAEWGDPTKYNLKVKRTGTGLETKYSIIPGLKSSTSESMREAVKEVDVTKLIKGALPLAQFIGGQPLPEVSKPQSDDVPVEAREPQGDIESEIPF